MLTSYNAIGTGLVAVSYTHLRAHETPEQLVCRLVLEKKKAMPWVHQNSSMVTKAQLAILICGVRGKERWPVYWEQDCSAATENLLIAAAQLGLGAV